MFKYATTDICWTLQIKSVEQIWLRHCREREREHSQQLATMRTRLNTMKQQMSKLRREMTELEAEMRCAEKNRVKEIAREKELTERFGHGFAKVSNCESCNGRQVEGTSFITCLQLRSTRVWPGVWRVTVNTLMGMLKLLSNGPLTMAIRWLPLMSGLLHVVQQGGDWVGCGPAHSPPHCTKYNSPPFNDQSTDSIHIIRCGTFVL